MKLFDEDRKYYIHSLSSYLINSVYYISEANSLFILYFGQIRRVLYVSSR